MTADLFETIGSLRSVRKFSPVPIDDDKLATILRCATMAPNASNIQPWRFVVVKDQQVKERIREVAVKAHLEVMEYLRATKRTRRMYEEGRFLTQNLPTVPVLVFVFADPRPFIEETKGIAHTAINLRIPSAWKQVNLSLAASVYPAVQNLLLAAKGLGISACLTTSITLKEKRVKEMLNVPKRFRLLGLIYLGYSTATMKPPSRRPVGEFIAYDQAGFG